MHPVITFTIWSSAATIVGICTVPFARKVPSYGWVAITLLLLSALAFILIESGAGLSSLPMSMLFLFIAPTAVVYSFRARRHAPDRLTALAAFVGGFIIGGLFLFTLAGLVLLIYEILATPA